MPIDDFAPIADDEPMPSTPDPRQAAALRRFGMLSRRLGGYLEASPGLLSLNVSLACLPISRRFARPPPMTYMTR